MFQLPDPPHSLWLDTYGPYSPEPSLEGNLAVDIAVVGGGFAGLAAAYEIKKAEPSLKVAVLEAKFVGYGASGRNGSFAMTVVGLGFGTTAMLRGKQFVKDAHTYMERAVDYTDQFIQNEGLDCERIRPGFLRVATTQGYIKRLQHDIEMMQALGFKGLTWIDRDRTREMVNSERYLGALWEPRLVLINPLKLVREEKRLVCQMGVRVFEDTPVLEMTTKPKIVIKTPEGSIQAEKVVLAANAYSHLIPGLHRKQTPAFTYMVATESLTPEQLAPIGWEGKQGVEDARNLIHYYRLTPDNRLVMGGGPVGLTYGARLDGDNDSNAWEHLERHIHFLFPNLHGVRITHRWGGPFSVTMDLAPALGYLGDHRVIYTLGCIGHGVSSSHLNAQAIRDLLLERQSELLDCPFINRRVISWPPEPLRFAAAVSLRGYLKLEDGLYERSLPKH